MKDHDGSECSKSYAMILRASNAKLREQRIGELDGKPATIYTNKTMVTRQIEERHFHSAGQ